MDQDETWHGGAPRMEVGLGPCHIVLDGDPAPSNGAQSLQFWLMSVVAKRLDRLRCHLIKR